MTVMSDLIRWSASTDFGVEHQRSEKSYR